MLQPVTSHIFRYCAANFRTRGGDSEGDQCVFRSSICEEDINHRRSDLYNAICASKAFGYQVVSMKRDFDVFLGFVTFRHHGPWRRGFVLGSTRTKADGLCGHLKSNLVECLKIFFLAWSIRFTTSTPEAHGRYSWGNETDKKTRSPE